MGEQQKPRDRILAAATRLLEAHGREAVSTRAVSAEAGVQPQTIYRQYGDMQGLMSAVAQHGFALYYDAKMAAEDEHIDAVAMLRRGWDAHVEFARTNPSLYALMFGDPGAATTAAAKDVQAVLHALLTAVARSGRLRVSVAEAMRIVLAANVGTALALIGTADAATTGDSVHVAAAPSASGDLSLAMREIVVTSLVDETGEQPSERAPTDAGRWAVALRAALPSASDRLTPGEHALLGELLDRLA